MHGRQTPTEAAWGIWWEKKYRPSGLRRHFRGHLAEGSESLLHAGVLWGALKKFGFQLLPPQNSDLGSLG